MRLLSLDAEGIGKLIEQMDKECEEIKKGALKMAWYMRGGISYTDVLNLSISERESLSKLIEENLETTKKTQMPFF
jgi:hypothetical protein